MFGKRITLFKLFGFKIRIDLSWIIIAILITWSLAQRLFPSYYRDLSILAYWIMGVFGAVGLFASITFHELWHSLIARKFGLQMRGITLFIFGGVAEIEEEPPSAKAEFFIAIAGPITSIFLGLIFHGIYLLGQNFSLYIPIIGIFAYLRSINFLLAAFNLLPGFPLDGGRVLRSALWKWKDDIKWATRVSSKLGSGFGIAFIFLGIFTFIQGSVIGGIWWIFIGLFLRSASQMSYQRLLMRQTLEGEPVRRFMKTDPVTVSPDITIDHLVEDYIYKHHFKTFPVIDNGEIRGCISTKKLKDIPREEWIKHTVGEIAESCSTDNSISPDADAMDALALIRRSDNSRLMVVDEGKLVGIISLKDLLGFLSIKFDLEGKT